MTSIELAWLSAIVLLVITSVAFVGLAMWSADGPAPWSIVPGITRGVRDWIHRQEELEAIHIVSPRAEEPSPPMETDALPLPPLHPDEPEPEAWLEEIDEDASTEIEIEDLGTRKR